MLELRATPEDQRVEPETEPLFSLTDVDGKTQVYSVPKKVPPNVALEYTGLLLGGMGLGAAQVMLLERLAGREACQALEQWPELTREQISGLLDTLHLKALGRIEADEETQGND